MAYNGKGLVRKIIIGDFGALSGLGTNINTGIRTGLSLTASGYLSGGEEVKPYTSSGENNFFRGAAADFQLKNLSTKFFCSVNRVDATIDSSAGQDERSIISFYTSGLHNSLSSLAKKDAVKEICYGVNILYDFNNLRMGIIWSENRFSFPVKLTESDPEELFDFEGRINSVLTAYYKTTLKSFIIFGEISSDRRKKLALVQGVSFRPAERININLLLRSYDPGYACFHGKGPFASSAGDNVRGIFGNFTFEAAKYLFISAGCDMRYYPWLRYRCSAPSNATSSEVRIRYLPREKISAELSYNYRLSMLNNPLSSGIKKQENDISRSFKASLKYSFNDHLTFFTRFDFKLAQPSGNRGFLLLQDMKLTPGGIPLSFWFRFCIFRTDGWDSRIYAYENDLPGSFNVPAFSGEGSRSYIMIEWRPSKLTDFRIKYAASEPAGGEKKNDGSCDLRLHVRLWF